jgi:hypothetical protein
MGSGAPLDRTYMNHLGNVSLQLAREAEAAGDNERGAGFRAEAKSWKKGEPKSDPRVKR